MLKVSLEIKKSLEMENFYFLFFDGAIFKSSWGLTEEAKLIMYAELSKEDQ